MGAHLEYREKPDDWWSLSESPLVYTLEEKTINYIFKTMPDHINRETFI